MIEIIKERIENHIINLTNKNVINKYQINLQKYHIGLVNKIPDLITLWDDKNVLYGNITGILKNTNESNVNENVNENNINVSSANENTENNHFLYNITLDDINQLGVNKYSFIRISKTTDYTNIKNYITTVLFVQSIEYQLLINNNYHKFVDKIINEHDLQFNANKLFKHFNNELYIINYFNTPIELVFYTTFDKNLKLKDNYDKDSFEKLLEDKKIAYYLKLIIPVVIRKKSVTNELKNKYLFVSNLKFYQDNNQLVKTNPINPFYGVIYPDSDQIHINILNNLDYNQILKNLSQPLVNINLDNDVIHVSVDKKIVNRHYDVFVVKKDRIIDNLFFTPYHNIPVTVNKKNYMLFFGLDKDHIIEFTKNQFITMKNIGIEKYYMEDMLDVLDDLLTKSDSILRISNMFKGIIYLDPVIMFDFVGNEIRNTYYIAGNIVDLSLISENKNWSSCYDLDGGFVHKLITKNTLVVYILDTRELFKLLYDTNIFTLVGSLHKYKNLILARHLLKLEKDTDDKIIKIRIGTRYGNCGCSMDDIIDTIRALILFANRLNMHHYYKDYISTDAVKSSMTIDDKTTNFYYLLKYRYRMIYKPRMKFDKNKLLDELRNIINESSVNNENIEV